MTRGGRQTRQGYGDGTYGPADRLTHAQAISLITLGTVRVGLWQAVTQGNPAHYPDVPLSSGHRLNRPTFAQYAGALPERPNRRA